MLETHGLAPKTERPLKSRLEPGQVFDSVGLRKFFDQQKAALHGACRYTMQFTVVVISEMQAWT